MYFIDLNIYFQWTVNGELRIGFFSKRKISKGEEVTFDYKYERYGQEAQKCFCGSEQCRGWLGGEPDKDDDEEEEEEVCSTLVLCITSFYVVPVEVLLRSKVDIIVDFFSK